MSDVRIALIDDYQGVGETAAEWSRLGAEVVAFREPWRDEDHAAEALAEFDVVGLIRERTPFPASLLRRLPRLKLLSMTGHRTTTLDAAACTELGIVVTYTTSTPSDATAELAVGLMIACARAIPVADAGMRAGRWQEGVRIGVPLMGARLGVVGLGKLGSKVAAVGRAFGMDVVAWSPNLTPERAEAGGARLVGKAELFAASDFVSIHLALSERTRGIVGAGELAALRPGSVLVNTARASLVDGAALLAILREGRIAAGLDVYDVEPLPADHPLRALPNVVLTPHLGYVVADVLDHYFKASLDNVEAFLSGAPRNVFNPEVIGRERPR